MPAKIECGGNRDRDEAGILAGKKEHDKLRCRLGDHRYAGTSREAQCHESGSSDERLLSEFSIGQGAREGAAPVIEVHAGCALGSVVKRVRQSLKVSAAERQ